MIRLLLSHDLSTGASLALDEAQSRYLTQVMRQGVGDDLRVFNGRDGEWRSVIAQVGKRTAVLTVMEQTRPQTAGPDLDLLVALVKRHRLDAIVEKAAELGVRRIRPVITERTNADHVRVDRLRAIAVEASEQTGRLDSPVVLEPVRLGAWLESAEPRQVMFCDESGEAPPAAQVLAGAPGGPWTILIGPEGGFSRAEQTRLRALPGVHPVSLGPRILRADTAAIAALTLWQALLGDWRPPEDPSQGLERGGIAP